MRRDVGNLRFEVESRRKYLIVDVSVKREAKPEDVRAVIGAPPVPSWKGVVIKGTAPDWIRSALVRRYFATQFIALYDPKHKGGIVVETHSPHVRVGTVIPVGGNGYKDEEEIKEIVDFVTEEVKQRIKQACEFYLRYKDDPELLIRERAECAKLLGDMLAEHYKQEESSDELWDDWFGGGVITLKTAIEHDAGFDFNEWLFRLAFKSVLEG